MTWQLLNGKITQLNNWSEEKNDPKQQQQQHITSQISIHKRNLQTHSKCKMLTNRTHCMAINFNSLHYSDSSSHVCFCVDALNISPFSSGAMSILVFCSNHQCAILSRKIKKLIKLNSTQLFVLFSHKIFIHFFIILNI